jgi:cell wall-associated NlpC family hydrolase
LLARTGPPRASRSAIRRSAHARPAAARVLRRPAILAALRAAHLAVFGVTRETGLVPRVAGHPRRASGRTTVARRAVHAARPVIHRRQTLRAVVTKHAAPTRTTRRVAVGGGMSAVIAYARSQVGRNYVSGGEGGDGFDCSGLTKRAYARAGISLPHSSRAQAARAHTISRRAARPGDLVVGRGHVGIYMGRGMMIDAGNHRTGVVYRKLYSGLRVERF